jgi:hypothetical protein
MTPTTTATTNPLAAQVWADLVSASVHAMQAIDRVMESGIERDDAVKALHEAAAAWLKERLPITARFVVGYSDADGEYRRRSCELGCDFLGKGLLLFAGDNLRESFRHYAWYLDHSNYSKRALRNAKAVRDWCALALRCLRLCSGLRDAP